VRIAIQTRLAGLSSEVQDMLRMAAVLGRAFDDALIGELSTAIDQMAADPAVRVLVISSTGKSFCAGADLNWMKRAAAYTAEENLRDSRALAEGDFLDFEEPYRTQR
jgi:methylglutaconyl-CoA hydratase